MVSVEFIIMIFHVGDFKVTVHLQNMKKYGIINFLNFIQNRYFLVQNLSQITILNSFPRKNIYFSRKKYFLTPRKSKKELEIYKICLRPSPLLPIFSNIARDQKVSGEPLPGSFLT